MLYGIYIATYNSLGYRTKCKTTLIVAVDFISFHFYFNKRGFIGLTVYEGGGYYFLNGVIVSV